MKDDILRKNIGNRIKQLRKEHGLTQKELSQMLGLNNESAISNYESGYSIPKDDIKFKICEIFNCSMDYLMGLTSTERPKETNSEEKTNINKFKIKSENNITKIYIDGKEIHGVREYKIKHSKQKAPMISLKMVLSEYDIELDNVCIKKEPLLKKIAHKIYSRFL